MCDDDDMSQGTYEELMGILDTAGAGGQVEDALPEPVTTWTTKDGRVLSIAEMETGHIENALAMVLRKLHPHRLEVEIAEVLYLSAVQKADSTDAVRDAIDAEITGLADLSEEELFSKYVPVVAAFVAELTKRGKRKSR